MRGASPLIDAPCERTRASIASTIALYPTHLRRRMGKAGCRVVMLRPSEQFADRSPYLAGMRDGGVDAWPLPPAGMCVVAERTVYLRSTSIMTVGHELAHALDFTLGGGTYLSGTDRSIRNAFRDARKFVTPYAASGLDEYFAESVRAFVGANDARSPWPPATRARLQALDPAMEEIIAAYFAEPLTMGTR